MNYQKKGEHETQKRNNSLNINELFTSAPDRSEKLHNKKQ